MEKEKIEANLRKIGFSGFVHLDKRKRDGKIRLTKVHSFGTGDWITILIVLDNFWTVEKVLADGKIGVKIKEKWFPNLIIDEVFDFFHNITSIEKDIETTYNK